MADLQKKADGKGISYPGTPNTGDAVLDSKTPGSKLYIFLNGGEDPVTHAKYPKVDMSLWDQATMCGTCHIGGATYEHDRNGNRLPLKTLTDMGSGDVNPFTTTVWESYTAQGAQTSFATIAPWVYPQYKENNPAKGPIMANPATAWVKTDPMGNPVATGQIAMQMKDPNTGASMPVYSGQLMMPNVKEMDCLFCHLSGYDNVMSSVMIQAGSLNASPGAGAGLFDMMPTSKTYMGYNGQNGTVSFMPYSTLQTGRVEMVALTQAMVNKIKPLPESNNCMQCHATKTLKNLPEMFGTTGTSNGFLSSAPMIYDPKPGHSMGPLGKRMTSYDINAMWLFPGATSAQINMGNMMSYLMPGLSYLQAQFPFYDQANVEAGLLGGGNPGHSGPLYYYNDLETMMDQNVLKRSVSPFPRAEWFKRGDAWQDGQDVHSSFGCAGCHFTGDSTHKNQCDPGRGHDMASSTQDGVPPISEKHIVKGYDADGKPIITTDPAEMAAAIKAHDTRNTVKRCEFCHVTGKDYYGNPITTYGAPNPSAAHAKFGLTANVVQIVDKMDIHGSYGGQGVSEQTNFTSANTKLGRGNHLDVMDCTVCHVQKASMAVRALDATSGMRFPVVVGTDPAQGMIGLFEDPAPDAFNEYARGQVNQMYQAINQATGANYPLIPAGTHVVGGKLQVWEPLHMWQKLGNMEAPITTDKVVAGAGNGGNSQMKFRRKLSLNNAISAIIWNNTDPKVDANGDTVNGGKLLGDGDANAKASLAGWKDVFDGSTPNKNNTQGYGEPIYDPWIMRDLKEGMNFGPSALSVISVGFGDFMGASGSAYTPDGFFNPSNYWKYASVWSGAIIFTEPNQIAEYKAFRTKIACGDENATGDSCAKSWKGTELAYVGAPFMVTHGVKPVSTHVKGKSCADCHAAGAGFFTGGYSMTGTAIPADEKFDRTSHVEINPANGDAIRVAGMFEPQKTDLMQRPLEPIRVKAFKDDLRTVFEGFNKLGQPRSSKFEGTDGTYVWTKDLERAEALYPEEDGAIYYKISDVAVDGTPKQNAVALTGPQYAAYMETLGNSPGAFGIGVAPVAVIDTIDGKLATGATSIPLLKGQSYALKVANPVSYTTYTWDTNAGVAVAPGTVTSVSFSKTGTWRITLTATNPDGKTVTSMQKVNVVEPVVISAGAASSTSVTTTVVKYGKTITDTKLMTTVPVTIAAGTDFDRVRIGWGDGSTSTSVAATSLSNLPAHQYLRFDKYKYTSAGVAGYRYSTIVQLFKGTTLVSSKTFKVFVAE